MHHISIRNMCQKSTMSEPGQLYQLAAFTLTSAWPTGINQWGHLQKISTITHIYLLADFSNLSILKIIRTFYFDITSQLYKQNVLHQLTLRMCVPYSRASKKCGRSLRVRCILPLFVASGNAEPVYFTMYLVNLRAVNIQNDLLSSVIKRHLCIHKRCIFSFKNLIKIQNYKHRRRGFCMVWWHYLGVMVNCLQ